MHFTTLSASTLLERAITEMGPTKVLYRVSSSAKLESICDSSMCFLPSLVCFNVLTLVVEVVGDVFVSSRDRGLDCLMGRTHSIPSGASRLEVHFSEDADKITPLHGTSKLAQRILAAPGKGS